jgi:hypothetical protein
MAGGPPVFAVVPRAFPGATIACLGTGPSLTRADVEACLAAHVRMIAINDAYTIAPEADVLFAADRQWWTWHRGAPLFAGPKYTLERLGEAWPGVRRLRRAASGGLTPAPDALTTGHSSGFSAINLAVHLGAARIVLLGYDMRTDPDPTREHTGDHFFGAHPNKSTPPFRQAIPMFDTLVAPLALAGVAIVNCSRRTAITAFPIAALEAVLAGELLEARP